MIRFEIETIEHLKLMSTIFLWLVMAIVVLVFGRVLFVFRTTDLGRSAFRAVIMLIIYLSLLIILDQLYFIVMEQFPDGRILNDEGKSFISLLLSVITILALAVSMWPGSNVVVEPRHAIALVDQLIALINEERAYSPRGTGRHLKFPWEEIQGPVNTVREEIKTPDKFGVLTEERVPVGVKASIRYTVVDPVQFLKQAPTSVDDFFRNYMTRSLETKCKEKKANNLPRELEDLQKTITDEIEGKNDLDIEKDFGVKLSKFSIGELEFPEWWTRAMSSEGIVRAIGEAVKILNTLSSEDPNLKWDGQVVLALAIQIVTGDKGALENLIGVGLATSLSKPRSK